MKSLWNSFKIAFAMFSKIPVPQADWSKENMKYMFCFFPFIGAVIGAVSLLVARAGWYFGFGNGFLTMVGNGASGDYRWNPCGRTSGHF